MNTNTHFWSYLTQFFLEWETFQTNILLEINTHILGSVTLFFFRKSVFDEITWKYTVGPYMPQTTIWRIHIAYWIPKATNTHSESVIIMAFPLQNLMYERASVVCFTYDCRVIKSKFAYQYIYIYNIRTQFRVAHNSTCTWSSES